MGYFLKTSLLASLIFAATTSISGAQDSYDKPSELPDPADIVLGDGEKNSITVEGVIWNGNILTFQRVVNSSKSFLVLHPFKDGRPVGDVYVAAKLLDAGDNQNVDITLNVDVNAGDTFLVMLHQDANDNGTFELGDGKKNVPDTPVFEGMTMIAHIIQAP